MLYCVFVLLRLNKVITLFVILFMVGGSPCSCLFHLCPPNCTASPRFHYHLPPCEDFRHSMDQQLRRQQPLTQTEVKDNSIPVRFSIQTMHFTYPTSDMTSWAAAALWTTYGAYLRPNMWCCSPANILQTDRWIRTCSCTVWWASLKLMSGSDIRVHNLSQIVFAGKIVFVNLICQISCHNIQWRSLWMRIAAWCTNSQPGEEVDEYQSVRLSV